MLTAVPAEPDVPPPPPAAADGPQPLEACVLMLLAHHRRAMSLAALRAAVARPEQAWTEEDFIDALESQGLRTQRGRSDKPPKPAPHEPLALLGPDGQACLLLARPEPGRYELMVPGAERPRSVDEDELRTRYDGRWVAVRPPSRLSQMVQGIARGAWPSRCTRGPRWPPR